jgi:protoheme IX farnesyltransferase
VSDTTALSDSLAATGARVSDYIELMKPRVMSLVVFSGVTGLVVAPGHIHPLLGFIAILCIALSAGGSAAVNMWYDRDIDAIMTRTQKRPLPQARVEPEAALEFGGTLIFLSVVLMGLALGWLPAALLLSASAFYIFVYTMFLKRRTPQNIVIGGAAGAFPPVIAWAAVTGRVDPPALLLFLLIFMWTPPHFWALALYRNEDYRRAGVPMLPVVSGARRTKLEMLVYTLLLFPVSLAPYFAHIAGPVYLVGAVVLSSLFIACAIAVWFDKTDVSARRMFGFSILYLFLLFALMLAEHAVNLFV